MCRYSFPSHSLPQVLWASETVGLSRSIQSGWVAPTAQPDHDTPSQGRGAHPAATKDPSADPLWSAQRGCKGKRSRVRFKPRSNFPSFLDSARCTSTLGSELRWWIRCIPLKWDSWCVTSGCQRLLWKQMQPVCCLGFNMFLSVAFFRNQAVTS